MNARLKAGRDNKNPETVPESQTGTDSPFEEAYLALDRLDSVFKLLLDNRIDPHGVRLDEAGQPRKALIRNAKTQMAIIERAILNEIGAARPSEAKEDHKGAKQN